MMAMKEKNYGNPGHQTRINKSVT